VRALCNLASSPLLLADIKQAEKTGKEERARPSSKTNALPLAVEKFLHRFSPFFPLLTGISLSVLARHRASGLGLARVRRWPSPIIYGASHEGRARPARGPESAENQWSSLPGELAFANTPVKPSTVSSIKQCDISTCPWPSRTPRGTDEHVLKVTPPPKDIALWSCRSPLGGGGIDSYRMSTGKKESCERETLFLPHFQSTDRLFVPDRPPRWLARTLTRACAREGDQNGAHAPAETIILLA